jgi:hypothetical protein
MQSLFKLTKQQVLIVFFLLSSFSPSLTHGQSTESLAVPGLDSSMPKSRELPAKEQTELGKLIRGRFKARVLRDAQYRAAGPFRFVASKSFLYVDRTDVGSVAFERSQYGISRKTLDASTITKERLLPRIEAALRRTGMEAGGLQFAGFHDEFAGAAQPQKLPSDFDPRKTSIHVARTAAFERIEDGVLIFGSELIVGLMLDESIGRFRLHWPRIEPAVIKEAQKLQEAIRTKTWTLPETMRSPDIEILDTTVGIGHSGFADPGFGAQAVVRVLVRKGTKDSQYPLFSTGYKYFDASGREIRFSSFPQLPGTPADKKSTDTKP